MSGVFKSIGKVFKKVLIAPIANILPKKWRKTVRKIATGVIIAGAVVLTAGAAIPAVGSAIGMGAAGLGGTLASVGITGTMASVVSGAITVGATGAVIGGASAAIQGKSVWKGVEGGFWTGAAAGAAAGAVGLIGPTGAYGTAAQKAAYASQMAGTSSTIAGSAGGNLLGGPGADTLGVATPGSATTSGPLTVFEGGNTLAQSTAMSAPASASGGLMSATGAPISTGYTGVSEALARNAAMGGGGGAGGGLLGGAGSKAALITAGGQLLSGFASGAAAGKSATEQMRMRMEEERLQADRIAMNYGYENQYARDGKGRVVAGSAPTGWRQVHQFAPMDLEEFTPPFAGQQAPAPFFQIINGRVVSTAGA